jgi:6-phosphogluconate dehydrogenase
MHIGLIGLGKMGNNMRDRLRKAGVEVTGYVMVPSGKITDDVITDLSKVLEAGDLVIDGGNSKFTEDAIHAEFLAKSDIKFMDCGVSGGVWGLDNGYGLMCGGDAADVERAMPVFDALRPEGPREEGFVHVGEVGSGHYAKMVHNGIEYAIMQAWGEGYELLSARTDLIKDVTGTFKAWERGTVVRSWLLELLVKALEEDPKLSAIEGYVDDSGEGRWTVQEALNNAVPVPTISAAIFARFVSRQGDQSPSMKAVAALRNQFGGHAVHKN